MITELGTHPDCYRKLGLIKDQVMPWEDGLRTDPAQTSFEWWYFDCQLDTGARLTIEFHTKPPYLSPRSPLTPCILLTLEQPDGTRIQKSYLAPAEAFSSSKERCDVHIGENFFTGDLTDYRIHVAIDELQVDVTLQGSLRCVRPETGHVFFGTDRQQYVAWLPTVPRGAVTARITIDGRTAELRGTGYHDHNWGNASLRKLVDHWYWGRAHVDDYTLVTLVFVSHEQYGKQTIRVCLIAKGSEMLAAGSDAVRFTATQTVPAPDTGVPIANHLVYELDSQQRRYLLTFQRRNDLHCLDFGKAGAYHRFGGDVRLEIQAGDRVLETAQGRAIWELLYFGPRP